MEQERTCLRDSEWSLIEGKLCLATAFVPMSGRIENGSVLASDQTTPYARVQLRLADGNGNISGFITNKLDFAMLWAAFNDNALALSGVLREPPLPRRSNLSQLPHEIWLVWTRKRYCWPANWVPKAGLSKLIVMIANKGAFEQFAGSQQYAAFEPILAWIPEVRLSSKERVLARHAEGTLNMLPEVWADVIAPI